MHINTVSFLRLVLIKQHSKTTLKLFKYSKLSKTFFGILPPGCTDVVGEPHHGHTSIASTGDRVSVTDTAVTSALRQKYATALQCHDQKHGGTSCLHDRHHIFATLLW